MASSELIASVVMNEFPFLHLAGLSRHRAIQFALDFPNHQFWHFPP